jgi:hypothetical protein
MSASPPRRGPTASTTHRPIASCSSRASLAAPRAEVQPSCRVLAQLIATRAAIAKLDEEGSRTAAELDAAHLVLSSDVHKLKEELEADVEERRAVA